MEIAKLKAELKKHFDAWDALLDNLEAKCESRESEFQNSLEDILHRIRDHYKLPISIEEDMFNNNTQIIVYAGVSTERTRYEIERYIVEKILCDYQLHIRRRLFVTCS